MGFKFRFHTEGGKIITIAAGSLEEAIQFFKRRHQHEEITMIINEDRADFLHDNPFFVLKIANFVVKI